MGLAAGTLLLATVAAASTATQITASVPVGATTGPIVVTARAR